MTDHQDEVLKKEDWRFYAIDKRGTVLVSIATQELLPGGGVVGFSLPSAPALYLSLAFAAHHKRQSVNVADLFDSHPAPQGIYPENHAPLFDYFETAMSEIIHSYSAIEAAANEVIPSRYVYQQPTKSGQKTVVYTRDEIERRLPLDEKLKRVLPKALKLASPAGGALWPPYLKLQDLRDRLIHLKSVDRKASGPADETIWGRLLRMGPMVFPEVAVDMIAHFYEPNRRWFKLRPTK
jgi:hypothetical protein